jgi:hypothetical protein
MISTYWRVFALSYILLPENNNEKDMKIAACLLIFCFLIDSCTNRTHLREKVIENNGITVRWYQISSITTIHEFVDIQRDGWTHNIMEANDAVIENVVINRDTVIIKATPGRPIYSLSSYVQRTYIRLDTSMLRW